MYQNPRDAGVIGSVRSTRTYYLELALGHDAILIHAGGSDVAGVEDAYGKIRAWGVTSLDGVRGPYMSNTEGGNLMWRDPGRVKANGYVHSVVTTGAKIDEIFSAASFRQDHKEGWTYQMDFADDGTPAGGTDAPVITVPFSNYKTGVFTYDQGTGRYLVSEYGDAYIDGNTGEQVGVTNVVVLRTACRSTGDSYGHVSVDLSSGGTGVLRLRRQGHRPGVEQVRARRTALLHRPGGQPHRLRPGQDLCEHRAPERPGDF